MSKDPATQFVKKLLSFSSSTFIGFIISFISTPIISRLFLPSEMGKINLFFTYVNLFVSIAYFGMDQTYVRFNYDSEDKNFKNRIMSFCLKVSLCAAVVISLGLILFRNQINVLITGIDGSYIAICMAVVIISDIFLRFSNLKLRVEQKALLYTVQALMITTLKKIVYAGAAIVKPNHFVAIVLVTVCFAITTVAFFAINLRKGFVLKTNIEPSLAKDIFKFALPIIPITLLAQLNSSIANILIRNYATFTEIGIFSAAATLASVINLLQTGFNTYWTPYVYENYEHYQHRIQKVHRIMTFAMVAFALCIIMGQDVLYLLLGENYRESRSFFPFLLVMPVCYTLSETTGVGINIVKKSYLNIITFAVNFTVNILVAVILLPIIGVTGAAIAVAAAGISMFVVRTLISEKYYKCMTKPIKTWSALIILLLASFLNLFIFDLIIIKTIVYLALLALLVLIFRSEFKILFGFGTRVLKKLFVK